MSAIILSNVIVIHGHQGKSIWNYVNHLGLYEMLLNRSLGYLGGAKLMGCYYRNADLATVNWFIGLNG